jgi:hypothetical protein
VPEEQTAEHLTRSRDDGDRQVATD